MKVRSEGILTALTVPGRRPTAVRVDSTAEIDPWGVEFYPPFREFHPSTTPKLRSIVRIYLSTGLRREMLLFAVEWHESRSGSAATKW